MKATTISKQVICSVARRSDGSLRKTDRRSGRATVMFSSILILLPCPLEHIKKIAVADPFQVFVVIASMSQYRDKVT